MIKKLFVKYVEKKIRLIDEHNVVSISAAQLHQATFLPYKNYCNGKKDIVVCGAGPSLSNYKPIQDAIHIAVNRAFIFEKVDFDFIFAQDMDGIRMVQDELVKYRPDKCTKFLAIAAEKPCKIIPETLAIRCNARRFMCDYYIYGSGYNSKMALDIENRALGGMPNVGMSVMQLALYMNPRKLYIVGCDMSGNHFAKGNQTEEEVEAQGKELKEHFDKDFDKLINKWKEIKEFAEIYYPEVQIITVNPIGLKGVFTDLYQEDI